MNRFIGLIDSGMGGLTVLNQIMGFLPEENTVYFGDMGRAPYGSRSRQVLKRYSEQIVRYLIDNYDLKLMVTACNTISAICLDHLQETFDLPIMGIIDPVPEKAISASTNGRIGVIGTRRTIESSVYQKKILSIDPSVRVYPQECPLFIHLVEEGWTKEPAARLIVGEYLANLKHSKIDTLILGCTHYPILKDMIKEYLGSDVLIIDPAVECITTIKAFLAEKGILNKGNYPERIYQVTDNPELFRSSGERYLDRKIHNVNLVDIGLLESKTAVC
ncbi:MAG: glutamate racemase [Deltaproteobacteria bacterium]|nr:glutamate racemase [Deltaproteobacteria bacterium]